MTDVADTTDASVADRFRPSGWLLAASTALGRAIEEQAVVTTPHSATTLDLLIRLSLAPDGDMRAVDLGRQMLKSPGYVSRLLDSAEHDGLVQRHPDPNDRRAQRVRLTAAGEDAVAQFIPEALAVLDRTVYAALDDAEVEAMIDMLRRITEASRTVLEDQAASR